MIKYILEALLLASGAPLSIAKMQTAFEEWERPSEAEILVALQDLNSDYTDRGIELKKISSGYRIQTKVSYHPWISRLLAEKPAKYSTALLEVLAIIAYKQPVTRGDIEDIRGVAVSSNMLKTLLERQWIQIAGQKDVPGKPAIYTTTKQFLDYFNLSSLQELPTIGLPHE